MSAPLTSFSPTAGVAELRSIARQIAHHSEALRGAIQHLQRTASGTSWTGTARDTFLATSTEFAAAANRTADRLGYASDALLRHVQTVEGALDAMGGR